MIEYRLIRSDRRTLSISVDSEGALVVHAPMRMAKRELEAFIRQKEAWIRDKQKLAQQRMASREQAALKEGAVFPFRGGALTVRFADVNAAYAENGKLVLPRTGDAEKHALKWRMRTAREILTPRVALWAEKTGLRPEKISFGNAKGRWGSMSSAGSLRLNAALVHLPPEMADYVIVHELAHRAHPDHSPAFHARVRSILPGADRIRQEMKQYAFVLALWQ